MKPSDLNGPVAYATVPTPSTRFWRTFAPYQLLRFLVINVKMLRLIFKSHAPPPGAAPHDPRP
ncbi:MAG: hypothetical protein KDK97_03725 [Verrucomicrobiales bacterium]|nr:hypothetical protein [Verrucomicrobiales bacterium]MCP5558942.1 hypothetical protein [Verrucomicrobiaceae bacterium]